MDFYELFKRWGDLKPKTQTRITEEQTTADLILFLKNIIKLKGFPETVKTDNLTLYGLLFGSYCIKEIDGKPQAYYCNLVGQPDDNGDFIDIKGGSIYNETIFNGVNMKDCVVGYNNSMRTPDYDIERFAYIFTQLDVSLIANIKYARLNKLFGVSDERTKAVLQSALKNADNGENGILLDTNMIKAMLSTGDGNGKPIYSLDLTDIRDIDKIQYINNAYIDLLKRLCWKYGLSMNLTPKMAQQSTEEIANADSGTTVIVDDMLAEYQRFCDNCNKFYGWNTYAELGNAWENKQKSLNMTSDKDGDEYDDNINESEGANNGEKQDI